MNLEIFFSNLVEQNIISVAQFQQILQQFEQINIPSAPDLPQTHIMEEPFTLNPEKKRTQNSVLEQEIERLSQQEQHQTQAGKILDESTTLSVDAHLLGLQKIGLPPKMPDNESRYLVLEILGEGGMGVVQRVQDCWLGREVAKKTLKSSFGNMGFFSKSQQVLLWRLNREASIMALLEHPNIVPLYDLQQKKNGELCFTMRKVTGDTLTQILHKKRTRTLRYSKEKLLNVFLKVCDAVAYAHSKGIVHRDLKPDNIMVGEFGEVYVMDWGIAKKLSSQKESFDAKIEFDVEIITAKTEHLLPLKNKSSSLVETVAQNEMIPSEKMSEIEGYHTIGSIGTPGYMAPEQRVDSRLVTPQSDIYTLGIILKQCFTKYSPIEIFQKELAYNAEKKAEKEGGKTFEETLEEQIPSDIQAIIKKATAEPPSDRYFSIREMAEDIERYLHDDQVSARKYSLLEMVAKWSKRHRQFVQLVLVAIVVAISFWGYSKQKRTQSFQKWYQSAQQQRKDLFEQIEQENMSREKQIQTLLNALTSVNQAILIQQKNVLAETEKYEISQALFDIFLETENYPMAQYLVNEMNSLHFLEPKKKEQMVQKLQYHITLRLGEHKKRLQFWEEKFRHEKIRAEDRENALFEISKMQEDEIFQRLLTFLEEGLDYFLNVPPEKYSESLSEFYEIMVLALGRLENPAAKKPILENLNTLLGKRQIELLQGKNVDLVVYSAALLNALFYTKSAQTLQEELPQIRDLLKLNQLFRQKTGSAYQQFFGVSENTLIPNPLELLVPGIKKDLNDPDKKPFNPLTNLFAPKKSATLYFKEALKKNTQKEYKKAIQQINLAIQIDSDPGYYYHRARFKKADGQIKEAKKDLLYFLKNAPKTHHEYAACEKLLQQIQNEEK